MNYESLKRLITQDKDRMNMLDPNQQGPHLPESTPEEDDLNQNVVSAVSGSMRLPPLTLGEKAAAEGMKKTYQAATNQAGATMDDLRRAVSKAGSESYRADVANANRLAKLKALLGR